MEGQQEESELEKAEMRACDLSDEVKGLASLCRMIACLGEQDKRDLSETDFVSAMHCVSATMDRYREEVENMVGVMGDANREIERLSKKSTAEK